MRRDSQERVCKTLIRLNNIEVSKVNKTKNKLLNISFVLRDKSTLYQPVVGAVGYFCFLKTNSMELIYNTENLLLDSSSSVFFCLISYLCQILQSLVCPFSVCFLPSLRCCVILSNLLLNFWIAEAFWYHSPPFHMPGNLQAFVQVQFLLKFFLRPILLKIQSQSTKTILVFSL